MKVFDTLLCAECDELVPVGTEHCPSCTCSTFIYLSSLVQVKELREEINLIRTIQKVMAS